jgi:hypothetical protein
MLCAQTNFFADTSYLRRPDHRPVLLNFGPSYFKSNDDWRGIFSVLEPTNRPAFFMLDQRLPIAEGGYDWPPMHLSQTNGGVLTQKALEDYLDHFEASARSWPASISSAFPRFQDYYRQAGVGPSLGSLDDADGKTFRFTLTRALTNHSAMVQIVTWNDFGEGTVVEPTAEYGYRDLGVIQDLRRKHLDPAFQYRAEDFALALKFYQLRRKHEGSARASAKLDEVFAQVVSGELKSARAGIKALDAPELSEAQPPTGR